MRKHLVLFITLVTVTLAGDIVHYDQGKKDSQTISQPNHPSSELYSSKK